MFFGCWPDCVRVVRLQYMLRIKQYVWGGLETVFHSVHQRALTRSWFSTVKCLIQDPRFSRSLSGISINLSLRKQQVCLHALLMNMYFGKMLYKYGHKHLKHLFKWTHEIKLNSKLHHSTSLLIHWFSQPTLYLNGFTGCLLEPLPVLTGQEAGNAPWTGCQSIAQHKFNQKKKKQYWRGTRLPVSPHSELISAQCATQAELISDNMK